MTEITTTVRDHRTYAEREVAERFPGEVAGHIMTVKHDNGIYRHLRFATPGSSFYWFEIVTWPGSLAIRGDMGLALVFSRIEDMLQFFRPGRGEPRINPRYWSEKLPDAGRSVKVYSERVFRDRFDEAVASYEREEYPERLATYEREHEAWETAWLAGRVSEPVAPTSPAAFRELLAEYEADDRLRFEGEARELLHELERAGAASHTYEWDLTDWDWPFLWLCHAIVWGITEYDRHRAGDSQ